MLHIVVPMAGRGSRLAAAGHCPKPFIEVEAGRPMLSYVVEHLRFAGHQAMRRKNGLRR